MRRIGMSMVAAILFGAGVAHATPSTVFWTPATPYVQPFGVLHVTYDTYFGTRRRPRFQQVQDRLSEGTKTMTWSEIQRAVQKAGIRPQDEVLSIDCEITEGSGTLLAIQLGRFVRLSKARSDEANQATRDSGC